MDFSRMAEYRRMAVLRHAHETRERIFARRGGIPFPAGYVDEILDDDSDRICCAAHAHLFLPEGAGVPPDIIEAEARAMATFTSSGTNATHADDEQPDDFTRTAEYRRRLALISQIKQIQADILADRGGEPIPAELLDEVIEEVKRGE